MTMSMISSYTPDDFNQEEDLYGKSLSSTFSKYNYQNPVRLFSLDTKDLFKSIFLSGQAVAVLSVHFSFRFYVHTF
jgi:hypothetical protein